MKLLLSTSAYPAHGRPSQIFAKISAMASDARRKIGTIIKPGV
jgi:hypothetical protein